MPPPGPVAPPGTALPDPVTTAPPPPPPLLPMMTATTTPMITTAATMAPMTVLDGPCWGAAALILAEASGRMGWELLSEQSLVKAVCRAGPDRQPGGTQQEARVAQDFLEVVRLGGRNGSPATEAAAVDGQAARPRRDDADLEGDHEQTAEDRGDTGEQPGQQEQPEEDLEHRQGVPDD